MNKILLITVILCLCCDIAWAESVPVLTVAYEGSNQSLRCQKMIAGVIRSRMQERHQTAEEVCYAKHQFSCWRSAGVPAQKRKLTATELETARLAWDQSIAGEANLYHDTSIKCPWKGVKLVKQEGDIIFYKE